MIIWNLLLRDFLCLVSESFCGLNCRSGVDRLTTLLVQVVLLLDLQILGNVPSILDFLKLVPRQLVHKVVFMSNLGIQLRLATSWLDQDLVLFPALIGRLFIWILVLDDLSHILRQR